MSSPGGGGGVYFLKSARKRHNVWVGGGGGCHFSAQHSTLDGAHKHGTAPFMHFYSESLSLSAFLFSGRAGTPLGQTSPCLWTGTYFFNLPILQPPCLHWHPTFVKGHGPQAIGCEVHVTLFDQPHLAPGNGLTVSLFQPYITRMGLQMHWVRCAAKIQPFNFFVSDQHRFLLMVCVAA